MRTKLIEIGKGTLAWKAREKEVYIEHIYMYNIYTYIYVISVMRESSKFYSRVQF